MANEIMRRHITRMVEDVITATLRRLQEDRIETAQDVRDAGRTLLCFSPEMEELARRTKSFLFARVYRSPSVSRVMTRAETLVEDLYHRFVAAPQEMHGAWSEALEGLDEARLARRVSDYLSGMTDSYAVSEHRRLFDDTPELR